MAATSGASIQIIKEVLGHTDIRTTQKYAHLDVLTHSQVFEAQKEKLAIKFNVANTEYKKQDLTPRARSQ